MRSDHALRDDDAASGPGSGEISLHDGSGAAPTTSLRGAEALTLLVIGLVAAAVLWFPLARSVVPVEVNCSDGWNAIRQHMAATGVPLYGAPPQYSITNYLPLSFHLVGLVGWWTGDVSLSVCPRTC